MISDDNATEFLDILHLVMMYYSFSIFFEFVKTVLRNFALMFTSILDYSSTFL